jgi:hypothetical protein
MLELLGRLVGKIVTFLNLGQTENSESKSAEGSTKLEQISEDWFSQEGPRYS